MLNILLVGAKGAMGRTLAEVVRENDNYKIIAGIDKDCDGGSDFPIYDDFSKVEAKADVIIDFSNRALLDDIISYASSREIPVIFATTGYTDEDLAKINKLSDKIAFMQEGNYSLGINIMLEAARLLAKGLSDFDIEIVESHHNKKKDNPSGTANMIFDAVNSAKDNKLNKVMREITHDDERKPTDVGISSVRAGTIVGEHRLIFAGVDEVLEVKHQAGSKKIFALGALKAASFIVDKKPGRYDFKDVIRGIDD